MRKLYLILSLKVLRFRPRFLHSFLNQTYQGQFYQYVCGRTDIQAAHMCGYEQPEGRCVLFINDIYGINSLGEALRMVQSGLGGKQLIVYIWHPSINNLIDNFHLRAHPSSLEIARSSRERVF